jgi:hypothetical protein
MKLLPALLLASLAFAPDDSPAVTRALEELARLRVLVDAGALPPSKLADAEANLADARDEQTLEHTLYARIPIEDLSERQADDMIAAAKRRIERHRQKLDHQLKLVDLGVIARTEIGDLESELQERRTALSLAEARADLVREIVEMARAEAAAAAEARDAPPPKEWKAKEWVDGTGPFGGPALKALTLAFEKQFSRPLPISARGSTAVHRALGLDHTGRIDVAVLPDSREGVWLRKYLEERSIPYYAFRVAIPGKATAPHIHIGPQSTRLKLSE